MKSIHLYLYRHGNTFNAGDRVVQVGATSDLPLTEKGVEQAHHFAQSLQSQGVLPALILSGSLKRQTHSADVLKSYFPHTKAERGVPALDEIDYGLWEGLTAEEIEEKWPQASKAWHTEARWPQNVVFNGSLEQHIALLSDLLASIYDRCNDQDNVILVSSNGIIRLFLYFSTLWAEITENQRMLEYKVGTGCFCQCTLLADARLQVNAWNQNLATANITI